MIGLHTFCCTAGAAAYMCRIQQVPEGMRLLPPTNLATCAICCCAGQGRPLDPQLPAAHLPMSNRPTPLRCCAGQGRLLGARGLRL